MYNIQLEIALPNATICNYNDFGRNTIHITQLDGWAQLFYEIYAEAIKELTFCHYFIVWTVQRPQHFEII